MIRHLPIAYLPIGSLQTDAPIWQRRLPLASDSFDRIGSYLVPQAREVSRAFIAPSSHQRFIIRVRAELF
jgi:hypothetical protein